MLDDLRDQASIQTEAAGIDDVERDRRREARVLAALRGSHLARASRHRQGVVYARAMFVEEAREVAAGMNQQPSDRREFRPKVGALWPRRGETYGQFC